MRRVRPSLTKRPASNRFAHKQNPLRSKYSTRICVPRRLMNTYNPPSSRVGIEPLAHQHLQPIERAAHIRWLTVRIHAQLTFREEHQPRESCGTTPPPESNRSSRRELPARNAPQINKLCRFRRGDRPIDALSTRFVTASLVSCPIFRRHRFRLGRLIPSCSQKLSVDNPLPSKRSSIPHQPSALTSSTFALLHRAAYLRTPRRRLSIRFPFFISRRFPSLGKTRIIRRYTITDICLQNETGVVGK